MTEYETAMITAQVMGNFLTAITVFLSIVSAYVFAAFTAGGRLSKIQLRIVNSCFLVSEVILGYLVVALFRRFFALAQSIYIERGYIANVDFTWPLCGLLVAIVLGSLMFMWNVRNANA